MKRITFLLLMLFCSGIVFSQKKSALFLNADISENTGATIAYNYVIKEKFGIGVAAEIVDFSSLDEGSMAALADFRYYYAINKSTIIPMIQIGKNLYDYEATIFNNKVSIKGGIQAAIGIGYSYNLWGKAGGLFTSVKYRYISIDSKTNDIKDSDSDGSIVFSIGFRL